MGIKERRERERQELRQDILAAARALAAQEGWQAVTIRKVAERIEYSPPTIYEYFDSKDAILLELIHEGMRILLADMEAARAGVDDPEAALHRIALAYWEFAWRHPELYQVMHSLSGVAFPSEAALPEEYNALADLVLSALQALVPPGTPRDVLEDGDILWATLHGLVSLALTDVIEGGRERGQRLVKRAVQTFIAGWRSA